MSKKMTRIDARVRCVQQFTGRGHESRPVNTGVKNDKGPSTDTGVILDTCSRAVQTNYSIMGSGSGFTLNLG